MNTTPPFIALPLELRTIIYKNLLTTDTIPTLYSTRADEATTALFHLDPAILRVKRQIYTEASWILYEQNEFRIVLCTDYSPNSDHEPEFYHAVTRPLLHRVTDPCTVAFPQTLVPLGGWHFSADLDPVCTYNDPFVHVYGLIYPHCLSRMHHIRLVTASSDIIPDGHYSASAGRFTIEIWRCLVDEDAKEVAVGEYAREKNKSLKMVIFGLGVLKKEIPRAGRFGVCGKTRLDLKVSAGRRSLEHVEEVCELFHVMKRSRACSVRY